MAITTPTQLATRSTNTSGQTSWVTGSVTFPAGSLGVLQFANAGGSNYPTGVSDSVSGAWTIRQHSSRNSQNWTATAYKYFASSTTCTVTTSFASSNETFGWLGYVTGTDSSSPEDANGNAQTFGTSLTPATSTTLAADDEIAFVVVCGSTNAAPTTWPTTGYTSLATPGDGVRGYAAAFEYRILSGGLGTTESTAISFAASRNMSAGIITFKPAAGGGGSITIYQLSALGVG